MHEIIELERRGGAAIIRLDRPHALNAWNHQLGIELLDAVPGPRRGRRGARRLHHGRGRAFTSGVDLRDLTDRGITAEGHIDVRTTLTTIYHPILTTLRRNPSSSSPRSTAPRPGSGARSR